MQFSAASSCLWLFVAAPLVGCAVDVFEGEVNQVSRSVADLNTTFERMVKAEGDAYFEREAATLTEQKAALRFGNGVNPLCESFDTFLITGELEKVREAVAACGLYYQTANSRPKKITREAEVGHGRALIRELALYATGLAELSAARDIEEVKAKAAKLREAVGALVAEAGKTAALAFPPVNAITTGIDVLSRVALWSFGEYVDYQRYRSFKAAVVAADDAIQLAEKPLADELSLLNAALIQSQMVALNSRLSSLPKKSEDVKDVLAEYDALHSLASVDPKRVASALSVSHATLKLAVLDPNRQKAALFEAINEFKKQVDALRNAVAELQNAGKQW